ncbi:MAG TPA: aminotransferase class I/II-fold pyridoxal phosphate-dependent enzyme [Gemmatimonadaceae bacterium]|nr:aminotransferase class I/II-fold pyridoxal phosphate-dependent enzyme [Gemmatimonadaceae bacterium]
MPTTAARLSHLPPYPLAHIPQKKRELIARGVDVIDLGAGDADLAPPPAAIEALAAAAREPAMSRYGFALGYPPFRESVAAFLQTRFGHAFDPLTEIVPLIGSKEGLSHLGLAYVGPGDATIIPDPGYNAYRGGTTLAGGDPYMYAITPRTNFLVELDDVPGDVLRRTKVLYLNYPNNPTSATAPMAYLERVVRQCRERNILLVYDNAYSEMTFDGYVAPSIFDVPGAREVAIEFHSFSKTFNMTGWRCAWACGDAKLVAPLAKVKSFTDTGQFMPIQRAAIAALETRAAWLPANLDVFRARRDAAVRAFADAGFATTTPRATMYLWIPLPAGVSSNAFSDALMEEGVVTLPGAGLGDGGEGFFRVSFITSPERIAEAARRAGKVLQDMAAKV